MNCGVPPIQNTQTDCVQVATCTLVVSYSTDLDCCVVFVDWVGLLLEHMLRTLKVCEWFTPNLHVISPYFACILALIAHLKSDSSQASVNISCHDKTAGSSWTAGFV